MIGGAIFGFRSNTGGVHDETAKQLVDLLRDVPRESFMMLDIDERTKQFVPYGSFCQRAADTIEKLLEERKQWQSRAR